MPSPWRKLWKPIRFVTPARFSAGRICRPNMSPERHIWRHWLFSILCKGRKNVVLVRQVDCDQSPLLQFFNRQRGKRYRFPWRLRFGVAFDVVPNVVRIPRSRDLHAPQEDCSPGIRERFQYSILERFTNFVTGVRIHRVQRRRCERQSERVKNRDRLVWLCYSCGPA